MSGKPHSYSFCLTLVWTFIRQYGQYTHCDLHEMTVSMDTLPQVPQSSIHPEDHWDWNRERKDLFR